MFNGRVHSKHRGILTLEEAEVIVRLPSTEEKLNESSPQIGKNGKRRKAVQQKEEKSKNKKEKKKRSRNPRTGVR